MLLALPLQLGAQETQLFTWTGRVDRQVNLTIQGGNTSTSAVRGNEFGGRFLVSSALPRQDGTVRVAVSGGRGDVVVVQQPNAGNGYSAVVRVADRSAGADRYQVTAYFTPTTGGRYDQGRNDQRRNDQGRYGRARNDNANNGRGVGQSAVLHWSGMVDANAEVRWQGSNVHQRPIRGNALRFVRSSVSGNVNSGRMRQGGQASVSVSEGRGQVNIVQQPSAANGYTTIVRISDPQRGYGRYTFDVILQ
jgi:hypothetical protein